MIADFFERHRPRVLDDVIGNARARNVVRRMLTSLGVPRGVVFHGPRGCGKTSLARILIRAQLCERREALDPNPCGACFPCRQRFASSLTFETGLIVRDGVKLTPDVVTADLELRETYRLMPVMYDEIQEASPEVQARLRTQLETACETNLVLCTSAIDKLDVAFRMRLVHIEVSAPGKQDMVEKLVVVAEAEGVRYDRSVLEDIAERQQCLPRRCLSDVFHLLLHGDELTEQAVAELRQMP